MALIGSVSAFRAFGSDFACFWSDPARVPGPPVPCASHHWQRCDCEEPEDRSTPPLMFHVNQARRTVVDLQRMPREPLSDVSRESRWLGSTGNSGAPRVSPARATGSAQSQADHRPRQSICGTSIARPYGLRSYTHGPAQADRQGCPSTRAPADRHDAASRAAKSRPVHGGRAHVSPRASARIAQRDHLSLDRADHSGEPTYRSARGACLYLRLTRWKEASRSRRCRPPHLRAYRPAGSSGTAPNQGAGTAALRLRGTRRPAHAPSMFHVNQRAPNRRRCRPPEDAPEPLSDQPLPPKARSKKAKPPSPSNSLELSGGRCFT